MANRKELETLFRQHYRAMFRMAMMLLHDEADSKDMVHDVFAHLLDSSTHLRPDTVETFLLTSVRNRCLNALRDRQLHEQVQRLYLLDMETDAAASALLEEDTQQLWQGIDLLHPPVCREVILLHFRDGLKFREIAQQFQVSETTVYKHLRHALQQLHAHLKKQ